MAYQCSSLFHQCPSHHVVVNAAANWHSKVTRERNANANTSKAIVPPDTEDNDAGRLTRAAWHGTLPSYRKSRLLPVQAQLT